MKNTKYLLIGGGLACANAAKAIREKDPAGPITLVGQEAFLPYNRPPLTKEYMRGEVVQEKVFVNDRAFYDERKIELMLSTAIEGLDAGKKTARTSNGDEVRFEKALLGMGARPITPPNLPGAGLPGVFVLRTMADCQRIAMHAAPGRKAVIVGGGFIGMELAASMSARGTTSTVVNHGPHVWSRFVDPTLGGFLQQYFAQRGVALCNSDEPAVITGKDRASAVTTRAGRELPCDFVVLAVGVTPNVELAQQAGLACDDGVIVNEFLQTSDPDIYCGGDLANYPDPYFGRRRRVEHWGQADCCGTLAGGNMAGAAGRYGLLTYVFSDLFDLHLEFSGDERLRDQTLVRGDPGTRSFSVLYLAGGRLTAHFSFNMPRAQYRVFDKLIAARTNLSGMEKQLADPAFAVASLLQPAVPAAK